jgi:hypothetical protein
MEAKTINMKNLWLMQGNFAKILYLTPPPLQEERGLSRPVGSPSPCLERGLGGEVNTSAYPYLGHKSTAYTQALGKLKHIAWGILLLWLILAPVTSAQSDPVIAFLRIPDGAEVRMAAPLEWFRRDVTRSRHAPTNYLLETDVDKLSETDRLSGAVVQAALLDETRLLQLLDMEVLPPAGEIGIAYLNTMLAAASPDLVILPPVEVAWTDNINAILLGVRYPPYLSLHVSGTLQQVLVAEVTGGLLVLTLYAPQNRWDNISLIWENMLASVVIDGELMPADPIRSALSELRMIE